MKDREFMLELEREILKRIPDSSSSVEYLEQLITYVLECSITHLQQSIIPERLDAIVCCLAFVHQSSTVRAYVFNKTAAETNDPYGVQRLCEEQVVD